MTEKKEKIKYTKVPLTKEQIDNIKLDLENAKIMLEDDKMLLQELEDKLDLKIPELQTKEMLAKLEGFLKEGKGEDANGKLKDLTVSDALEFKLVIEKLQKQLKLDLPARRLRLSINSLRKKMEHLGYPGNQIKKLERQIKMKCAEVYAPEPEGGTYCG